MPAAWRVASAGGILRGVVEGRGASLIRRVGVRAAGDPSAEDSSETLSGEARSVDVETGVLHVGHRGQCCFTCAHSPAQITGSTLPYEQDAQDEATPGGRATIQFVLSDSSSRQRRRCNPPERCTWHRCGQSQLALQSGWQTAAQTTTKPPPLCCFPHPAATVPNSAAVPEAEMQRRAKVRVLDCCVGLPRQAGAGVDHAIFRDPPYR